MGVFIKFYGLDPLPMTWNRFYSLLNAIPGVEDFFRPRNPLDHALMVKEEQIKRYYLEHPNELPTRRN